MVTELLSWYHTLSVTLTRGVWKYVVTNILILWHHVRTHCMIWYTGFMTMAQWTTGGEMGDPK